MTRKEVAVIIAAIGLLGCILVPVLQKMKIRCMASNCSGNLKQLGLATDMYGSDNKGMLPGPQPLGIGYPGISWDRILTSEMGITLGPAGLQEPLAKLTLAHSEAKNLDVFTCTYDPLREGARLIPEVPGSLADGMAAGTGICRSYVMNLGSGNLVPGLDDGIAPATPAIPPKKIGIPAGTVHLIESQGYATVFGQRCLANDTYLTCDKATGTLSPKGAISDFLAPIHGGTKARPQTNVLMYDGHVERLGQESVSADHGKVMQYGK